MFRVIPLSLLAVGWLVATAAAQPGSPAADAQPAMPQGLRVFYASHSLMWYVPEPLGKMAETRGITGHKLVGLQPLGASRTIQHWNLPDDKNEAKQALKTGDVDVFVMSPISFPDEGVENYIQLGLAHNPKLKFIVQLSWGGGDIDNQDFPNGAFDNVDKEKTPEQLRELYQRNIKAGETQIAQLNEKYGHGKTIIALVPSAQAMQTLRIRIAKQEWPGLIRQSELFVDPVHPAPPMEALNTYLHFAVLYGQNPVGLPQPATLKNAKRAEWNEKFNRALQELAWETVKQYPPSLVPALQKK